MEAYSLQRWIAPGLSRRRVFHGAAATVAVGLLPLPTAAQIDEATNGLGLAEFMALSRWLTETQDLSPELGRAYHDSLQRGLLGAGGLKALLEEPGFRTAAPSKSTEPVAEAAGVPRRQSDDTARMILKLWYTGLYEAPDGRPVAAAFIETLAWRAVGYTAAPSQCKGATNHWTDPPDRAANE